MHIAIECGKQIYTQRESNISSCHLPFTRLYFLSNGPSACMLCDRYVRMLSSYCAMCMFLFTVHQVCKRLICRKNKVKRMGILIVIICIRAKAHIPAFYSHKDYLTKLILTRQKAAIRVKVFVFTSKKKTISWTHATWHQDFLFRNSLMENTKWDCGIKYLDARRCKLQFSSITKRSHSI